MNKTLLSLSLSLALLSGCASLAPDYNRPKAVTPEDWPQGAAYKPATASTSRSTSPTRSPSPSKPVRTMAVMAAETTSTRLRCVRSQQSYGQLLNDGPPAAGGPFSVVLHISTPPDNPTHGKACSLCPKLEEARLWPT